MYKYLISLFFLLSSLSSSACLKTKDLYGIFPKNDLRIPISPGLQTGIDRKAFNSIIDRADSLYSPVVSEMGGRLVIKKNWRDDTVNAFAEKKGNLRLIEMFGGFARHPLTTNDVFMFVVCHEIGHHVGGVPMIHSMKELWASNEGQSDYFAGTKCMRKLLINEDNVSIMAKVDVPELVKSKCELSFGAANEQALCQRISMAGFGLASIFRAIRKSEEISFSTPDPKIVWKTWFLHPIPQCRLDTYFQSALCPIDHNEDPSYEDENIGSCSKKNGHTFGARPLCWFAPR